ncbi:MAG: glutamate--cysteine ligase [Halieaceae bacterium]|nr:glutamate--cysteine ligase [Halieaceae bacterium]
MSVSWQQQLDDLAREHPGMLRHIARGIEKESLRVDRNGMLAQTPHPAGLGSALTHERITTDYSEALLEFITPVSTSIEETLAELENVHCHVYRQIGDERLWSASMPCIVAGDAGIPVAQYGTSNIGRMKTIYRLGLGHRYGRMMQAIAGIHYNFSMPEAYWPLAQAADGARDSLQDYITKRYLGLIRNFHRWSWLLIYLFGASPAVCASFLRGRGEHDLEPLDADGSTLHRPYATALRMGDLGYNSSAQRSLRVCYNRLDNYLTTLTDAILTPHEPYAAYRGKRDGEYMQLNDSLLQIENEFYSTIRPKRPARSGETALSALHDRGIEYVEVRCIDVNPFHPVGIDAATIRFLDSFLLHCLTAPSPECNEEVQDQQAENRARVVNRGREPGLTLRDGAQQRELVAWARELLADLQHPARLLDEAHGGSDYAAAVGQQLAKLSGTEELPSARVLRELHEKQIPFSRLALHYSNHWAAHFRDAAFDADADAALTREAAASLERQARLEAADREDFESYLDAYYDQYRAIRAEL